MFDFSKERDDEANLKNYYCCLIVTLLVKIIRYMYLKKVINIKMKVHVLTKHNLQKQYMMNYLIICYMVN